MVVSPPGVSGVIFPDICVQCPPFIDLCPFEVPVKDQRESNLPNMGQLCRGQSPSRDRHQTVNGKSQNQRTENCGLREATGGLRVWGVQSLKDRRKLGGYIL